VRTTYVYFRALRSVHSLLSSYRLCGKRCSFGGGLVILSFTGRTFCVVEYAVSGTHVVRAFGVHSRHRCSSPQWRQQRKRSTSSTKVIIMYKRAAAVFPYAFPSRPSLSRPTQRPRAFTARSRRQTFGGPNAKTLARRRCPGRLLLLRGFFGKYPPINFLVRIAAICVCRNIGY